MKKVLICIIAILFFSAQAYAQGGDPGDCDPTVTDPGHPDYCIPVPVDEGVVFLLIAGIGFGLWKLRNTAQFASKPPYFVHDPNR